MRNIRSIQFGPAARCLFTLLAVFYFLPAPAQSSIDSRYLFIFDTSAAMKKCLPAVTNQIDNLFVSSLGGQVQNGDSIGVWVFNSELHSGVLPLQRWSPDMASAIAGTIKSVLVRQWYSKTTRFSVLQPRLDDVVKNSERLTVLIFTDGDGQFSGTPYDADINAVFSQKKETQKELKQPFVLVLRAQLGKYVAANIGLPPGTIGLPEFPPLPLPPAPANNPSAAPSPLPPSPAPVAAPLIIIGTNVGTTPPPEEMPPLHAHPPIKSVAVETPPPPMATNVINVTNITNVVVVVLKTNLAPVVPPVAANLASQTNETVVLPAAMDSISKGLAVGGAVLLAVAAALGTFLVMRSRHRDRTSLITQTLNKKN